MARNLLAFLAIYLATLLAYVNVHASNVTYDGYSLFVDGVRHYIWSGEFHPFRLPNPDLWRDVLQKMKSGGYSAVQIYVHWGYHSSKQGVYDFTGVRDMDKFFSIAEEVGIWVLARPGPYINAETTAGGFAPWLSTTISGKARTSASDYQAAWTEWFSAIDPIIEAHQYTQGGSVILLQVENEYTGGDAVYMQQLIDKYHADGITIPLYHNDIGNAGRWASGKGSVQMYAWDSYPQGFNCHSPTSWAGLPGTYTKRSANEPLFIAEFQGGSFDAWGGAGYDNCRLLTDYDFERVFYKYNILQGVTLQNFYMTYGGTNWGQLAEPDVYSSYDYGSAIKESRELTPKYNENKLIGYFLQAVKDITKTDSFTPGAADNSVIVVGGRQNPDTGARFYIVRHNVSSATTSDTFHIPLSSTYPTVPQQAQLTLNGRDSKIIVANYTLNSQFLQYSTAEIMTHASLGNRDIAIVYANQGEAGEVVLKYSQAPTVTVLNSDAVTSVYANGDLRLNFLHNTFTPVSITVSGGRTFLLIIASRNTAYQFWRHETASGTVLTRGPYLVRTVTTSSSTISLTGDLNGTTTLEVFAPSAFTTVQWNGQTVTTTATAWGSFTATLSGAPAITIPQLTSWQFAVESPERLVSFNDSNWIVCNKQSTLNPVAPPAGQPVLYSDDYGFHMGNTLYRGHFIGSTAQTGVAIIAQGGTDFAYSVFLNSILLGSSTTNNATVNFTFPNNVMVGVDNVVTVICDNMGQNEDPSGETYKNYRGLRSGTLIGSSSNITWHIQGNQGGENMLDKVRGTYNVGGLYGERYGWHLPGFPYATSANNWNSIGALPHAFSIPGVAWYRTTFSLNIPANVDAPIAIQIDDDKSKAYRAQIYVNGWQFGKYVNNLGPQILFPIPPGILNTIGVNTLAISVWCLNQNSCSIGTVTLQSSGTYSYGGSAISLVNSPAFNASVYGPSSGVQGSYEIANGGFETGTLSPWLSQWNANLAGVETNHPSSGTYDAYIHPTSALNCSIYQDFPANTTGTYTLSARADTSIPNQVQLGVDIQGVQANQTIIATGGYQTYTITFVAAAGNLVKVWFYSPSANGTYQYGPWGTLDNVQITSIVPGLFGILNGGFETGMMSPWQAEWNVGLVGLETNHPSSGTYDAYLHPTSTLDCAIYQKFNASTTRTYTLSARADTSITNLVQLGVDVQGVQANKTIITSGGYKTYTISFTATAGNLIKVWFYSPAVNGSSPWATLDDVQVL